MKKIKALWEVANDDPLAAVTLCAALVFAVLSLTKILESPSVLTAATLAVLALLTSSMLRQIPGEIRRQQADEESREEVARIHTVVDDLRQGITSSNRVREVPGPSISEQFEAAMEDTDSWWFKGGSGTFLRSWTLPELAKKRDGGKKIPVTIDILDPRDPSCDAYADYRRLLEGDTEHPRWTPRYVRTEVAASLLAATWYRQHSFLEVTVVLSRGVSALRYDIGSSSAIVTHADKSFPALVAMRDSRLYDAFVAELNQSVGADEFSLLAAPPLPPSRTEVTAADAAELLRALALDPDEVDVDRLPGFAFNHKNPYPVG